MVQASYASCQPAPRVAAPCVVTGRLVSRWGGRHLHDFVPAEILVEIDKVVHMKVGGKGAEFEALKKLLRGNDKQLCC